MFTMTGSGATTAQQQQQQQRQQSRYGSNSGGGGGGDEGSSYFDIVIRLFEARGVKRVPTKRQAVVAQCSIGGIVSVCRRTATPQPADELCMCSLLQLHESPPAAWGRGDRAHSPIWGDDAVMRWQLSDAALERLTNSRDPHLRVHLYVYTRKQPAKHAPR